MELYDIYEVKDGNSVQMCTCIGRECADRLKRQLEQNRDCDDIEYCIRSSET